MADANGMATGLLVGPIAQQASAQFPGSGRVRMEARVLQRYEREGCARFALRVIPDGLPEGSPSDMTLSMNWCLDGTFPEPEVSQ